jgi:hypothetical protein
MLKSVEVTIHTSVSGTKTRKISWVKREEKSQMKVKKISLFFVLQNQKIFHFTKKIAMKGDNEISCYGSFTTEG